MNFSGHCAVRQTAIFFFCANVISACSALSLQEPSETASSAHQPELQSSDRTIADRELQTALESSVSGEPVYWNNPSSGASGSITPLKTWKTDEGTYCRSYRENIKFSSGKSMNRRGVACRSSDAVWTAA